MLYAPTEAGPNERDGNPLAIAEAGVHVGLGTHAPTEMSGAADTQDDHTNTEPARDAAAIKSFGLILTPLTRVSQSKRCQ